LPRYNLVSPVAGEIWYASSVMAGLLLFGLAIFFFVFGVLPYWFKLHKHLHEILGCALSLVCAHVLKLNFDVYKAGR
jgi:type III secretory pathway component EscU